jgi:hypothetical protein
MLAGRNILALLLALALFAFPRQLDYQITLSDGTG